jgi:hypothetical protein
LILSFNSSATYYKFFIAFSAKVLSILPAPEKVFDPWALWEFISIVPLAALVT